MYAIIFYSNGSVYTGDCHNFKKEGWGWIIERNGNICQGKWHLDSFTEGSFSTPLGVESVKILNGLMGVKYFANHIDPKITKKKMHERQKTVIGLENAGIYEGDLKNCKRSGTGRMYYNDGGLYLGEWKSGQRHGKGVYYSEQGDCYSGDWINDKREGKGIMKQINGSLYTGRWLNGLMDGPGELEEEGLVKRGRWKENMFVENYGDKPSFAKTLSESDTWVRKPVATGHTKKSKTRAMGENSKARIKAKKRIGKIKGR